jgi:hypothetical protein
MSSVPISSVTPDFQQLYDALSQKLAQNGTWVDLLPTSVGTTLLDLFAGATVSNQLYLDLAFREAFLPTAVRDSSIFAGSRMLGVSISRKKSASCTAELTNNSARTQFVVPYSQFAIGSLFFYNREQYTIPPYTTISNANLYQGIVREKEFVLSTMSSLALKEAVLSEPGFVVTSEDLLVYTKDVGTRTVIIWDRTDQAIFEHTGGDAVYFESTTRDGDVSLLFGDGEYGRLLARNENLYIRYIVSQGADGNLGLPGKGITLPQFQDIKGVTKTNIGGGANEKSALYYKLFAPNMFRTKRRIISGVDYRAQIMAYPGVADVSIMGQRDIAPDDLRWMNMVRVCLLPEESDTFGGANPNPTSADWDYFLAWLKDKRHNAYAIQKWNPERVFVTVRAKIALFPTVAENDIRLLATDKILSLFQKKPGILGRRLSQSDVVNSLRRIEGVDYVEIISPVEDILMPDICHYPALNGTPVFDMVYSERTIGTIGAY